MDRERIRERLEAYLEARARLVHARDGGGEASPARPLREGLLRLDERFADVTGGEALEAARRGLGEATLAGDRDSWRRLVGLLERVALGVRTRDPWLRVEERERRGPVTVGGVPRCLDAGWAELAEARDGAARDHLFQALARAEREIEPFREELWGRRLEALGGLGYPRPLGFAESLLPGVSFEEWGTRLGSFLSLTEGMYHDRLRRELEGLGVRPDRATEADLAFLARLHPHDRWLRARHAREALAFTLEGVGRAARELGGIALEDGGFRGDPRPRLAVLRVPGELRLRLRPRDGLGYILELLEHATRALALRFVSPGLPVERRWAGDPALGYLWGYLATMRLREPAWVALSPAAPVAGRFLADLRLRALGEARALAGRARFELALGGAASLDAGALRERWVEEMREATGAVHAAAAWLRGAVPYPRALARFRALSLEAQIAGHCRERFGSQFWRTRGHGELLKELWSTGGTLTAEELGRELGLGPVTTDRLLGDLLR